MVLDQEVRRQRKSKPRKSQIGMYVYLIGIISSKNSNFFVSVQTTVSDLTVHKLSKEEQVPFLAHACASMYYEYTGVCCIGKEKSELSIQKC